MVENKRKTWRENSSVSVGETVEFLNEMLGLDRQFTERLMWARIRCNRQIAEHESIQCRSEPGGGRGKAGFLGVLNGVFGIDKNGFGPITGDVDEMDETHIVRFRMTDSDKIEKQVLEEKGRKSER